MKYNTELEKLYTAINVANCKRNELRINKKKIKERLFESWLWKCWYFRSRDRLTLIIQSVYSLPQGYTEVENLKQPMGWESLWNIQKKKHTFNIFNWRGWRTFLTSRAWLLRNLSKRRKSEVQFIQKIGQKRLRHRRFVKKRIGYYLSFSWTLLSFFSFFHFFLRSSRSPEPLPPDHPFFHSPR